MRILNGWPARGFATVASAIRNDPLIALPGSKISFSMATMTRLFSFFLAPLTQLTRTFSADDEGGAVIQVSGEVSSGA